MASQAQCNYLSVLFLICIFISNYKVSSYELCSKCEKPLINEANLEELRNNWIKWGVVGAVAGGMLGAFGLPLLGFGSAGVTAGSIAAGVQGPTVAAGSIFAICQSLGATGLGTLLFGAAGSIAGGGALGLIYKYRALFDWCTCYDL